uniref:Uncharacterized protein n=1 Tax=Candidatus Kentrum sp. TC TaxID=2126339 RepID=A0A451AGD0_9GAMM|nr:MAG: hypothetical protein BECKTC1821E_GA0114239_11513 [Candidatus Kentron sp. TC]VFK52408.1 MAG: hypothetical protein BECKTC1821D_GA0114238_11783 [Candidatus Kentron sp. TC]VFK65034.1 MAG: hypothetical protein BECKTC1821F_GA0114240_11593 [Candidatus Kentron sp. TC]
METISKGHFTLKRIFEDNWEQFRFIWKRYTFNYT